MFLTLASLNVSDCVSVSRPQEASGEALLGRGVEKGSLQKRSTSSRKLGRQEVDGALGSLGLKSKLKDKLSIIRQDRAERRESLQKQDAIHEVDSSEDETDEGSEDSQEGRRGAPFTPPPLLRPTTVRTGPGGTLPSLCLSPCTTHATFSHTGASPPQVLAAEPKAAPKSTSSSGDNAGQDGKSLGASVPPQRALPFSTPGSAFISVSKDSFLRPAPPTTAASVPSPGPPEPQSTTSAPDLRTPSAQEVSGPSCPSPSVSKEKKEADNRRLAASDLDQPATQSADKAGVLGALRVTAALDKKAAAPKQSRGGATEARHQPAGLRSEPIASAASEPKRKRSDPLTSASTASAASTTNASTTSAAYASSQQDKTASKKT